MDGNFGAIFAAVGRAVPPADPALIHGGSVTKWGDFDRRTDALAVAYLDAGAVPGDKVAHLMRNGPEYSEAVAATFKARLVHVNVNYRYTGEELFYILDNSDAAVLVHDAEFGAIVAELRPRLPKLKLCLEVGPAFDAAADSGASLPPQDYRGDDLIFVYTGGTTGRPKGVMWAQADLWTLMGGGAELGGVPLPSLDALVANVAAGVGRQKALVLPPLMHGTGMLAMLGTLTRGGCVITLPSPAFDPIEALAACAEHRPDYLAVVGDAFARPLLAALDAGRGSIASVRTILSSGTMWSSEVKAGLLRHNPAMLLLDSLSSSESFGIGVSVQEAASAGQPTRFIQSVETLVLDEAMVPVVPGSGAIGRLARGGLIPRGYYKDPDKSAATFVRIGGTTYSIAGDYATVDADGQFVLLGRGSHCINTGGEKVFPEEVEEALKTHAAVDDALVFGVADDRWGQAVTAIVAGSAVSEAELIAHVKTRLAPYKAPKRVYNVAEVPRAPNGKADYARAKELALTAA